MLLDTDRQKTASNWLSLRTEEAAEELSPLSVLANSADPLHEIESLSRRYELVVVDIGAQNYRALVECAMLADVYVVPTSTSALDLDTTEDLFQLLRRLKTKGRRKSVDACAVLCKVPIHPHSREVLRTQARLAESDVDLLQSTLPLRSAWRSMANTGRALHELPGRHQDDRATDEMQRLYDEVVARLTT